MEITVDRSIRHWWVFVLRGIVFTAVGIYLFAEPESGYVALGFLFGLIIFLTGVAELIRAYKDTSAANRGWHLFTGIVDIMIGVVLMQHLAASLTVMRFIVGFYFLYRGLTIVSFRALARGTWWVIAGCIAVLIAVIMIWVNPAFGAATIIIWTALAFIVTGALNVLLGLRMRRVAELRN